MLKYCIVRSKGICQWQIDGRKSSCRMDRDVECGVRRGGSLLGSRIVAVGEVVRLQVLHGGMGSHCCGNQLTEVDWREQSRSRC